MRGIPAYSGYPRGFLGAACSAGIKKAPKAQASTLPKDMTLLVSEEPCLAAACFTQNRFQAAPVRVSRDTLQACQGQGIRAVITNSGCANACTGDLGLAHARSMCQQVDALLGCTRESTLVLSTGVIGQLLPMDRIQAGIQQLHPQLANTHETWVRCAEAFMTTDTFPKLRCREVKLPSSKETIRIAGISKGAGMIHPNMATMLGVLWTDAKLKDAQQLQAITRYVTDRSFNCISIDGDTSTNDTVLVLANGMAMQQPLEAPQDLEAFQDALLDLSRELAQLIVRDGEGATKFVTVQVTNAVTREDAKQVANAICTSALVKTALYGQDANWGRIIAAIGYAETQHVQPERVHLSIASGMLHEKEETLRSMKQQQQQPPQPGTEEPLQLVRNGQPCPVQEERASAIFRCPEIIIHVDLGGDKEGKETGDGNQVTMWTCDFSKEYVAINADYRS